MRKLIFLFILFFATHNLLSQGWSYQLAPKFRQLHHVEVFSPNHISLLGGNPSLDSIAYMAYSINAAQSWTFSEIVPGKMFKTAVFFDNVQGLASGLNSRLYKTTNGGQSWLPASYNLPISQLTVNKLCHAGNGVVYAAGGNNGTNAFIVKSLNYGDTWTMHNTFPSHEIYGLSLSQPSHLRICGPDNYLQYSNDDGTNWISPTILGLDSIVNLMSLDFYGNFGICVGGRRGNDSISVILRTTDGGTNWTAILAASGPQLNDVDVINDTLAYAVGDYGLVLKTTDGGLSWTEELIPGNPEQDLFVVNFSNSHLGGIAGRWGVLFIYDDGVVTFPTATTDEATQITINSARLNAEVSAGFFPVAVSFIYGTQDPPNIEVFSDSVYGDSLQHIYLDIANLDIGTGYYFRIKVSNQFGEFHGEVKSFQTPSPEYEMILGGAYDVTYNAATLSARVSVSGVPSAVYLVYGAQNIPETEIFLDTLYNQHDVLFTHPLSNLQENTSYFYRLKISNFHQDTLSAAKSFFTGNPIPNWNFENWETISYERPKAWFSNGNIYKQMQCANGLAVELKAPITHEGFVEPPMVANVIAENDWFYGGYPISVRPNVLNISIKYDVEYGDSVTIGVGLLKDNAIASPNFYYFTGSSNGLYVDTSFNIIYEDIFVGATDTLIIGFINSVPFNDDVVLNNFFTICNMSFDEPSIILPNMDFSEWIQISFEVPQNWDYGKNNYNDYVPDVPYTFSFYKTTDAYYKDYALCLQSQFIADTLMGGILRDTLRGNICNKFPVNQRHQTFMGYYRYYPEPGDEASVNVVFFNNGNAIGWGHLTISETINTWEKFVLPIHYHDTILIPDSARISFSSSKNDNQKPSILCIDKLSFDGDFVPVEKPQELKPDIVVYPNPFKDVLHIDFNGLYGQEFLVEMFDLNGKRIYAEIINDIRHSISTSFLGNGLYLLRISSGKDIVLRKVIKI